MGFSLTEEGANFELGANCKESVMEKSWIKFCEKERDWASKLRLENEVGLNWIGIDWIRCKNKSISIIIQMLPLQMRDAIIDWPFGLHSIGRYKALGIF